MSHAIQPHLPKTTLKAHYYVPKLLILGLLFHFLYIGTVFDCYFTSPVVHGMQSHSIGHAESKRLVLIVGDGLRADLLFTEDAFSTIPNAPKVVAPYLKSIAKTRGAFGISHTRVPTESRPGHVAIIGGMYEDVSAVTKGWKSNPVSLVTSSDIFSANPKEDATFLDIWVLDQLKELFQNATSDGNLNAHLRSNKVVFFLHLLGLDTTGHSYRPHSREYMNSIQVVDDIVRQTESLINEFYNDQDTSFIFTADHGMSVIGNHGDGDPDNTRTPLIAWGRGIRGPLPDSTPSSHDPYSKSWGLGHLFRRDVEQADLAALMASLIAIDWPVNSVGVLPDVDPTQPGYLSPALGDESLAEMALVNAKVILEQYTTKHELKKARAFFYKPFVALEGLDAISDLPHRLANLANIERLNRVKDWRAARLLSAELIQTSLSGLHYLQTYDRFLIRGIVIFAYIGWAAYTTLYIFRPLDFVKAQEVSGTVIVHAIIAIVLSGFWTLFALQHAPFTFYVYIVFPCYFWHQFFQQAMARLYMPPRASYWKFLSRAGMTFMVLQVMVIGYTHRFIWSIGFVLIGVVWPFTWSGETLKKNLTLAAAWGLVCLSAAVFPVLSVEKQESLPAILTGGCLILTCGVCAGLWTLNEVERVKGKKSRQALTTLFICQAILIVGIMIVTARSVRSLQAKQGLPLHNQVLGWAILGIYLTLTIDGRHLRDSLQVVSSVLAFSSGSSGHTAFSKFLVYFLGFGPCFVILSISIEGLFYVSYSFVLATWVVVESVVRNGRLPETTTQRERTKVYLFQPDDLRIALFFLFFVQVGFFGTGK
ncbi:hypothetical protein C0992_008208 [Termitomyces sp. T32_za158]|nr:hypothetical protein C0992_008208 [Termitomyces sp. T32_za158]